VAELEEAVTLQKPDLPTWAKMMPGAEPVPSKPLTPSRPDEKQELVRSPLKVAEQMMADKVKYHRGRIIHKLLEILPDIDNQEAAMQRFLSQDAHDLSQADIRQISDEVMTILNNPDLAGLFGPSSRSEVPIVGQIGSFSLSGSVDRLAVTDKEVLIVDYKTNRPPPMNVEKIPLIYQRQMAAYRAVLKEIYPDKQLRSFLLWTDIASLMEIPDELLNKIKF
ncbi:MAG: PD-(D/E)XK nuclease family protein, partial [Emcibacteraceae bacterium]|nr:PD-(D/E)XK nuclease family protein [Emcibacteraceae bacterium]